MDLEWSAYRPGWPWTHRVFASRMIGLKACAAMPGRNKKFDNRLI